MIITILGRILIAIGAFMSLPIIVALIYAENTIFAFLLPGVALIALGILLAKKPKKTEIFAKDGLIIVGLSWILISIFGAFPYYLSGEIPSFIDCIFESSSGFTTTGASIVADVESLSKSILFWRSLTQYLGGMGVLVFVLAFMPSTDVRGIHLFRAESPGYTANKFVSKMKSTAILLYLIYIALTLLEFILLCFKMPVFDSLCHSMTTAATGGFSTKNASIAHYDSIYIEVVISIFMFIFGINFNLLYLIFIGKLLKVFKNEELKYYALITLISIVIVSVCVSLQIGTGNAIRYSVFNVLSAISTTGFNLYGLDIIPSFALLVLTILIFMGACGGSTSGGVKISRVLIATKSTLREVQTLASPKIIKQAKFESRVIDEQTKKAVLHFFFCYLLIFLLALLLLSLDKFDLGTNFFAIASSLTNGPMLSTFSDFAEFTPFSKILLNFCMILGRLELYPILILLLRKAWK